MDNDSLLDVIDDTDLGNVFGSQNDTQASLLNWADEFLLDENEAAPGSVAMDTGNLATNANPPSNPLLTSQSYAVHSSIPAQNIVAPVTSQLPAGLGVNLAGASAQQSMMFVGSQATANTAQAGQLLKGGNQSVIIKTASGQQIQLNRQAQLQLLQQQQQQQPVAGNFSFTHIVDNSQQQPQPMGMAAQPTPNAIGRSLTPGGSTVSLQYGGAQVVQTVTQMKRASPAPNVNLVHLPPTVQQQQPAQQQFQIAPGTIVQLPSATAGATQQLTNTATLFQGQAPTILGNQQQGNMINSNNAAVLQNPNIVSVNVAQPQQRDNLGINIQGTLIQTAEGKSILIPSQNIAHPINIQGLSVATQLTQQPAVQQTQPTQNTLAGMLLAQQQQQQVPAQSPANTGMQQLVLNHQGQQILVQRQLTPATNQLSAGVSPNLVRTAGGQLGIVQIQQRPTSQPVHNAQLQTQQINTAGGLKMMNIGGQSISLQQLSSQLGNIQGLQLGQPQQQQQQLTFQTQGQSTSTANLTFQGSGVNVQGHQETTMVTQQVQPQQVLGTGSPLSSLQVNTSGSNVQNQTQLILQQIQNSLRRSQGSVNVSAANVLNVNTANLRTSVASQAVQNSNVKIKQEYPSSTGGVSLNNLYSANQTSMQPVVKTETNLLEGLIKQEADVKPNLASCSIQSSSSSIHALLTKSGSLATTSYTAATTTLSQASTQMSLFVLSNSGQNVLSNTSSSVTPATAMNSLSMPAPSVSFNSAGNTLMTSFGSTTVTSLGSSQSTPLQQSPGVSGGMQKIHLTPELQQQLQRIQLEIRKVQMSSTMTNEQKQTQLAQLQSFQKRILLKGRVLATAKSEPNPLQQSMAALDQSVSSSSVLSSLVSSTLSGTSSSATAKLLASGNSAAAPSQNFLQQTLASLQQSITQKSTNQNEKSLGTSASMPTVVACTKAPSPSPTGHVMSSVAKENIPSIVHQVMPSSQFSANQQPAARIPTSYPTNQQQALGSPGLFSANQQQVNSTYSTNQQSVSTANPFSSNQIQAVESSTLFSANQQQSLATPSQSNVMTTQSNSQSVPQTSTASAMPQVAVPTQIKIADKVLTLSLTPAQKEKVQSYLDRMTPDQQQQYLQTQQHVLTRIQKQQALNAQIRAQVEAQKRLAAANNGQTPTPASSPGPGMATAAEGPMGDVSVKLEPKTSPYDASAVPKPELKTIPVPNPNVSIPSVKSETPTQNRAVKRPYMDIPKGTLINQQIRQDQNHAVAPDTKRPFRSRGDACRRLLRFHVFQSYGPKESEFEKFDGYMDEISADLLRKKDRMLDKFRQLLVLETIRERQSSELVMLQRMHNQDLRKLIEEEKLSARLDPDSFTPMPAKYLYRSQQSTSMTSEASLTTDQDTADEDAESQGENLDSTHRTSSQADDSNEDVLNANIESQQAVDSKVGKLVIKSDGMNFSSAFKRKSLDQRQTTMMELCESAENSNGSDNDMSQEVNSVPVFGEDLSRDEDTGEYHGAGSVTVDDDDTNDYSNDKFNSSMEDETEQATLAISSADESEDTCMDGNLDSFNGNHSNAYHMRSDDQSDNLGGHDVEMSNNSLFYSKQETSRRGVHTSMHDNDFLHGGDNTSGMDQHSHTADNHGQAGSLLVPQDVDNSDSLDRFDMYQPITECLTDSEENSFYTADQNRDQNSASSHGLQSSHWGKNLDNMDSDLDSDVDVKAQMESAINSILSLSHGGADAAASMYSYTSQSNQFLRPDAGHGSQSNPLFQGTDNLSLELGLQDNDEDNGVATSHASSERDQLTSDLDAAVSNIPT